MLFERISSVTENKCSVTSVKLSLLTRDCIFNLNTKYHINCSFLAWAPKFHTRKTLRKCFGVNKLSNIWKSPLIKLQHKNLRLNRTYLHFQESSTICFFYFFYSCSKLLISVKCLLRTILHRDIKIWSFPAHPQQNDGPLKFSRNWTKTIF